MRNIGKILLRYSLSAAGIAMFLLVVNLFLLFFWIGQSSKFVPMSRISDLSPNLIRTGETFEFSPASYAAVIEHYQWAMLLDKGGHVIWDLNLPEDLPRTYNVVDVASFTRWYLKDYPVYVWRHPDGLFVLGCPKGSQWKIGIELPQQVMDLSLIWFPLILLFNGLLALGLALILGFRFVRSVKPLAYGIEEMATQRPVALSEKGLLGGLAAGINAASRKLRQQEIALSKRDNARTTWIAGVSHDIRTPLSIAMGYASELESDAALPNDVQHRAGIIRRQTERIQSLVSNLNLVSKLEYDMQPLHKKEFSLSAMLRSVVADILNSGSAQNHTLEVHIAPEAQNATLIADEELLYRTVCNLVTNSVVHNPDGCDISISLKKDAGRWQICVSDTGCGFEQGLLAHLNSPNPSYSLDSHGLGLALVCLIVRAHDGSTRFENYPKIGCAVFICLPPDSETF